MYENDGGKSRGGVDRAQDRISISVAGIIVIL